MKRSQIVVLVFMGFSLVALEGCGRPPSDCNNSYYQSDTDRNECRARQANGYRPSTFWMFGNHTYIAPSTSSSLAGTVAGSSSGVSSVARGGLGATGAAHASVSVGE